MKPGNFLALCGVALAIATLQIADATREFLFDIFTGLPIKKNYLIKNENAANSIQKIRTS